MRTFEALLSFVNLLTFFVLTIPLSQGMLWTGHMAPVALLITIVQMLVEGSRWQMLPAYTLAGLFFLVWSRQNSVPPAAAPSAQVFAIGLIAKIAVSSVSSRSAGASSIENCYVRYRSLCYFVLRIETVRGLVIFYKNAG